MTEPNGGIQPKSRPRKQTLPASACAESTMTPHQRAVQAAGGTLIIGPRLVDIDRDLRIYAPGCGSLTYVEATNGGQMPCGAMLTQLDGTKAPYFCARCQPAGAPPPT